LNASTLSRWTLLWLLLVGSTLPAFPLPAQTGRPVDAAALLDPPAAEWLTYGRDYAETHFSPLRQIDSGNVDRLRLAWSLEVGSEDRVEATPLVWNGTLYATTTWSVVFAADAVTGELKWRWDPGIVRGGPDAGGPSICCGPVNRGVALYDGKVYAGLLDGRLVALDAETGRIVWIVQTTPRGQDYSITGAPRVVKGKVIIGNGGAEFPVRGFVTAYDALTGEQVWRFYTVPGDPSQPFENEAMRHAASTWSGDWWKFGGGGTAWDGMAYDPAADLLYIGTGNGSPWNHEIRSRGSGDNLYLASILALRPDSGELVWHYQTVPGDHWDYTATQPMILADLTLRGRRRAVLMQAPKNGFFYVLDRHTGELLSAEPYSYATWATEIDIETGRPRENPGARYGTAGATIWPGPAGAHNWQPMSWNPETGLVYIPGRDGGRVYLAVDPADFTFERGARSTGVNSTGVADQEPGTDREFLLAWDPVEQKERWRVGFDSRDRRPRRLGQGRVLNGGTLATAGNLVFYGTEAGDFTAFDARTGSVLWEVPLHPGMATPVTYEIEGTQYVSVLSGARGNQARVYTFKLDDR